MLSQIRTSYMVMKSLAKSVWLFTSSGSGFAWVNKHAPVSCSGWNCCDERNFNHLCEASQKWEDDLSVTLTQAHDCGIDKQKFACLQDKVRTTQPITTKLGSYITLGRLITWLDFGGILLKFYVLPNFLWKFWMCFFKVKHCIGHISGMVGLIDVKRKRGASVECWVNWVTFDLWPQPWPWPLIFQGQFSK